MKSSIILHLSSFILLCSCGVGGDRFAMKGKFQNLNQGEFYVYGLDGTKAKIDTIRVERGQFNYETACEEPTTLMLVFPNFTEQPIFAQPGGSVEVRADVSNLKELEVLGTKDNALMTTFRKQIIGMSPPKQRELVEKFVRENPESMVSIYLIRRYFMQGSDADYGKAERLLTSINTPNNNQLLQLKQKAKSMKQMMKGTAIPSFSATDFNGGKQTDAVLKGSQLAVVTTFASWNFESQSMLRQLRNVKKKAGGKLKVMSIVMDANHRECKRILERDSINWPVIVDDKFFDSNIVRQFGFTNASDNVLYENGRVVDHGMNSSDLIKVIEQRLK